MGAPKPVALSEKELMRYDRQIRLPSISREGQLKLKSSKVLVAGAGGLGSPISIYLAAAGVGHIVVVDRDEVEISNLNRQILHWEEDVGKYKAISAAEKLRRINSDIVVEGVVEEITEGSIDRLLAGVDVLIDAMDNMETRFVLNKAAVRRRVPFIHGAIYGLEGQVTTIIPGRTACLRCIFKGAKPHEAFPVLGVAPAVIGALEATEAIKYIVGFGELLLNRMLIFDGESMRFYEVQLQRDPSCPVCSSVQ